MRGINPVRSFSGFDWLLWRDGASLLLINRRTRSGKWASKSMWISINNVNYRSDLLVFGKEKQYEYTIRQMPMHTQMEVY